MLEYPSLEYWNHGILGSPVYAFSKLDGSNLRYTWGKNRKENNGFYKFGTRNVLIDESNPDFGNAVTVFLNKYSEPLNRIFRDKKEYRNTINFTIFGEYLGPNSFAGQHVKTDVMDVIMFDIIPYKKDFMIPKEFVKNFGHLGIPDVVYEGNLNKELVTAVKRNDFNLSEGVICKGVQKIRSEDTVWMVKIKTNTWFDKLRERFGQKAVEEETKGEIFLAE